VKKRQKCNQIIFFKLIRNFYCGKSSQKFWTTSVIFQKLPKINDCQIGEKFAQSGGSPNFSTLKNAQTVVAVNSVVGLAPEPGS
jgi:hypothetical protein